MDASPCCPDALRERVGAIAAAARAEAENASVSHSDEQAEQYAQRIEATATQTRSRSFWQRSPLISIAAVLLLSVAGVLIWQSANFGAYTVVPRAGMTLEQAAYTEHVGRFVLSEHNRCCEDEAAQAKLIKHDINAAITYFSDVFGQPVHLPDMARAQGRIEFYGGGDCDVPSTARSGHLRFDAIDQQGERIPLSLFIAPNPDIIPLEEGVTYSIDTKECREAGAHLFMWVSDGIQYILVSEAPDSASARVRGLMDAPESMSEI